MDLLTSLERACSSPNRLHVVESGVSRPWRDVWDTSAVVAGSLDRLGVGGAVGAMLTVSQEAVSFIAGALRSGRDLVSLPLPSRGASLEDYGRDLLAVCELVEVEVLVAERDVAALLEASGLTGKLRIVTFDELVVGNPGPDRAGGRLIQFTSGSTALPKGIPLSTERLGAEVDAIIERGGLTQDRPGTSWLPLSHDMGLVGMLLCLWVSGAELTLAAPQTFLSNPLTWLESWSATKAYVTAAPNFALDLVVRALGRHPLPGGVDLSAMRWLICGGEVVRPATLRRFAEVTAPYGFNSQGIAPAYGMAEAVLAVTILSPDQHWGSVTVDGAELVEGRLVVSDAGDHSVELSGNGPALNGFKAAGSTLDAVSGFGSTGELTVEGPSLFDGYVGAAPRSGAHRTGDLGAVVQGGALDGQVLVTGRLDDLIAVRGRNLYAIELEAALSGVEGLRAGCAACVADTDGGYLVVAESAAGADRADVARRARATLAKASAVAPSSVWFVPAGTLPKTTSGKKQRSKLAAAVLGGTLAVEQVETFRRTS